MAKRKKPTGNEVPEWVVTYGDLMSLLLCFFILLAAFSELKKPDEFRKVLEQIREAIGASGGIGIAEILEAGGTVIVNDLDIRSKRGSQGKSSDSNPQSNVTGSNENVSFVHEGQRFAVGGSIPFDVAEFELTRFAEDTLRTEIAPQIRDQNFVVMIVGHAWGAQELAAGFSLDELAFKRAEVIKQFLVRECGVSPSILRIESAGATEPASLDASSVDAAVVNRRVQVYQTGRTVAQVHPDPNFTSVDVP